VPFAFFTYKLKPGVTADAYQQWIVSFDYPQVRQIPSIRSQQLFNIAGLVFGPGDAPADFAEVIEYSNWERYQDDLANHPAAQKIKAQLPNFVTVVSQMHGDLIPPGA
jgi:REDY-like protein HapK